MSTWDLVQGFLIALFCGSLIGMERERDKRSGKRDAAAAATPGFNPAGVRTHLMVAILAAILRLLDETLAAHHAFTLAGLAITSLLAAIAYGIRAAQTRRYGITTMFGLVATYGLGALALTELRVVAAGGAVVIAAVLVAKAPLHRLADALTAEEIAAAIKLGLIAVVLLPLLPNRSLGPADWPWLEQRLVELGLTPAQLAALDLFNPFAIWLLVVLISGVGFVGYLLMRTLGAEKGLTLTGLVGGLVSSTAVSLSMAEQSKRAPHLKNPFVSAVLAAGAVMAGRVMVIVLALAPALAGRILPPMLAMGGSALAFAWVLARKKDPELADKPAAPVDVHTPFALAPALKLAALFLAVRVVAGVMTLFFGGAGLLAIAALSGMVDVDAITASVALQAGAGGGTVSSGLAIGAIFTAVTVNTIVKASMVLLAGSRRVGRATFLWMLATLAFGAAGLAVALAF